MKNGAAVLKEGEPAFSAEVPFITDDPQGVRRFWNPPECSPQEIVSHGITMAHRFAMAARKPTMAMMLPLIIEEMLGAKEGALANTVGGAFLVELARLASASDT
jgi:hypothetical protein